MDSNTTPTSRRNKTRSRGSGPQQESNIGFSQFSQQQPLPYFPQFENPNVGFQQSPPPYFPQFENPNVGFQIPYFTQAVQPAFNFPQASNFPQRTNFSQASTDEEEEEEEGDEVVPETQQSNPTPTSEGKGKGNTKFPNRSKPQKWTKDEEVALLSAYIEISEDPVTGNAQKIDGFWKRVRNEFFNVIGVQDRSVHQITSKCNSLKTKLTRFSAIYNNEINKRGSGTSDADILVKAHNRYSREVGVAFNHEHCWKLVKDHPKWSVVPTMSTPTSRASKRSKTSESSVGHFSVADDEEDDVEIQEPQRPIGRNKAKKASMSNTTGSTTDEKFTCLLSEMRGFKDEYHASNDYRMKKLDIEFGREERIDYEFFMSPHDHLTGDALEVTKKRKERMKKKYNW